MKFILALILCLASVDSLASAQAFTAAKIAGAEERAIMVTWAALLTGNTGTPVQNPTYTYRVVQASGTFGGATVVLEGSNDGTTYYTLTDTASTPGNISFTSAGLKKILTTTRYIRPSVSGGAAASIDINLLLVKP